MSIQIAHPRNAPYDEEPGYYAPASLWLYGNVKLLHGQLAHVADVCISRSHAPEELDRVAKVAEELVLEGKILVCGVHSLGHRKTAIVPLRWGSPRIVVFSGGFYHHLGADLSEEPFPAARLWRFQWDARTDLAVSLRSPSEKPMIGWQRAVDVGPSRRIESIHSEDAG